MAHTVRRRQACRSELAPRRALYDRVADLGRQVDVLVNNAGFGIHGDFLDIE